MLQSCLSTFTLIVEVEILSALPACKVLQPLFLQLLRGKVVHELKKVPAGRCTVNV